MKFKYDSNNSGGVWWLSDEDWKSLESAGWRVNWRDGRRLGALATSAECEFETLAECVASFERATGQDASDEGCSCCGPPHSFQWGKGDDWDCVGGEEIARRLHGTSLTYRQALDRIAELEGK